MKDAQLHLLYRILNEGRENSHVEVLRFFTESSPVSGKLLNETYQKYRFHNGEELLFHTMEEMGRFAVEILKEMGAMEVLVLSDVDYNIGLDACSNLDDFKSVFTRYGSVIENPETPRSRSNSIFGKLFN